MTLIDIEEVTLREIDAPPSVPTTLVRLEIGKNLKDFNYKVEE